MSYLDTLPDDLRTKIIGVIKTHPESIDAFNSLYFYLIEKQQRQSNYSEDDLISNKRRKLQSNSKALDNDNDNKNDNDNNAAIAIDSDSIILLLPKLSFQSPLRKKLNLLFVLNKVTNKPILAVTRAVDEDVTTEVELVLSKLTNSNVTFAAFLPVIEKPKLQHLVLFYKESVDISALQSNITAKTNSKAKNAKNNTTSINNNNSDPIILSFNQDNLVQDLQSQQQTNTGGGLSENDTNYKRLIIRQASICGFKIEDPFAPAAAAAATSNGINSNGAFFVEAHKGTKEGVLYFLPNNILFGFKKPILLFDSRDIKSITYSSITRITFNITLLVKRPNPNSSNENEEEFIEEKVEFSMIDQSEFGKIDSYIKSKEVIDNSMAEELKAKPAKNSNKGFDNEELQKQLGGDNDNQEGDAGKGEEEDSDDEEEDGTYQIGDEVDDTSDVSDDDYEGESNGDDDEDDDEDDEDED